VHTVNDANVSDCHDNLAQMIVSAVDWNEFTLVDKSVTPLRAACVLGERPASVLGELPASSDPVADATTTTATAYLTPAASA